MSVMNIKEYVLVIYTAQIQSAALSAVVAKDSKQEKLTVLTLMSVLVRGLALIQPSVEILQDRDWQKNVRNI